MEHPETRHGLRSYLIGFVLAVILSAVPFWLVYTHALPPQRTLLVIGRRSRPARGEHSQGACVELDREARLALERLDGGVDHALPERTLVRGRHDTLAEAHDAFEHLVLAIATVTNADQLLLRGEQEADRPLQLRLRGCGGFRGSLVVRARGGACGPVMRD